jgi:hypothetical protein
MRKHEAYVPDTLSVEGAGMVTISVVDHNGVEPGTADKSASIMLYTWQARELLAALPAAIEDAEKATAAYLS